MEATAHTPGVGINKQSRMAPVRSKACRLSGTGLPAQRFFAPGRRLEQKHASQHIDRPRSGKALTVSGKASTVARGRYPVNIDGRIVDQRRHLGARPSVPTASHCSGVL